MRKGGNDKVLGKLIRAVMTIVGAIVGYGFYLLVKYWAGLQGYDLETILSLAEHIFVVTALALIFAIIFYKLFPKFLHLLFQLQKFYFLFPLQN